MEVRSKNGHGWTTRGKVYQVESENTSNYVITDDRGFTIGYRKEFFDIIEEEEELMTCSEFCHNDTQFYGEVVDNIKQIALRSFNGEELKEYVEHHIKMYLEKRKS